MTEEFVECADESQGFLSEKQHVTGKKGKWIVIKKIGDGGYGSVYKVLGEDGTEAALKLERKEARRKRMKLEMEAQVLKEVQEVLKKKQTQPEEHFVEIFDKAKKEQFGFLVMSLLGESLADLRRARQPPRFSLGTAYALALKTLESIKILHETGYLHRDIKPANYAIGRDGKKRLVYILDFGIARKFVKEGDSVKTPREKVAFKGTVRYAPLGCHAQRELGPKDDVESWLYMCVDFGNPDGCNWRGIKDKEAVYRSKKEARSEEGRKRLFNGYIDNLHPVDKVDYDYPVALIERAAKKVKVEINAPYDWELEPPKDKRLKTKKRDPSFELSDGLQMMPSKSNQEIPV